MKRVILCSLIASSLLLAEGEDIKKVDTTIKTHTELGYIKSDGNSETETFTLDAKVSKGWDKHIATLAVDAEYATEEEETIKNKYKVQFNYNYEITKPLLFDFLAVYKYDEFSGLDYSAYSGLGLKYIALDIAKHKLSLSSHILYSQDKVIDEEAEDYSAFRAEMNYAWQIKESLKFEQTLSYRVNMEDDELYFANSKSALISKISDIFSASVSYKVDYVNIVLPEIEQTDRTFMINLIADF